MNGLSNKDLGTWIMATADSNQVNPVVEYMESLEWDGVERIKDLAELCDASNLDAANISWNVFFLSACAAADAGVRGCALNRDAHPSFEYVLTLQGTQGINKTKGIRRLLPRPLQQYFKEAMVLDLARPDSIKQAVSYWITELGELDATFGKSQIAHLKGHISQQKDVLRLPYGRSHSNFDRRTLHMGSVNPGEFLRDSTGNRRFQPISITRMPQLDDKIANQMWAEAWHAYVHGEQWWPTADEDVVLADAVKEFEEESPLMQLVREGFLWDLDHGVMAPRRMTASEIYREVNPLNSRTPNAKDFSDISAAMTKLWKEHGAKIHAGKLKVNVRISGQGAVRHVKKFVRVNSSDGKNRGWLTPSKDWKLPVEAK